MLEKEFSDTLHAKEKKTIILVTHDIELVKYSHRTVYVKDGEIVKVSQNHTKK